MLQCSRHVAVFVWSKRCTEFALNCSLPQVAFLHRKVDLAMNYLNFEHPAVASAMKLKASIEKALSGQRLQIEVCMSCKCYRR